MRDKQKLILGFVLGLLGLFLWNLYYDSYDKLYTVGEVTGSSVGLKSGTSVQFVFYMDGAKIEGSSWKGSYSVKNGEKFIIEFGKTDLTISSILLYYPVPDSLVLDIPKVGWIEIPEEIKRHRLKRTVDFGLREYFHKD